MSCARGSDDDGSAVRCRSCPRFCMCAYHTLCVGRVQAQVCVCWCMTWPGWGSCLATSPWVPVKPALLSPHPVPLQLPPLQPGSSPLPAGTSGNGVGKVKRHAQRAIKTDHVGLKLDFIFFLFIRGVWSEESHDDRLQSQLNMPWGNITINYTQGCQIVGVTAKRRPCIAINRLDGCVV